MCQESLGEVDAVFEGPFLKRLGGIDGQMNGSKGDQLYRTLPCLFAGLQIVAQASPAMRP